MENLRIQLITWNVSCASPLDAMWMSKLFDIDGSVDIYVVSLQEVESGVFETMFSYLFYDDWTSNMLSLFAETNYYLVENIRLQGLSVSVFAHLSHLPHIRFIRTDLKRTGFGGYWGNKGGVAISCNVYGKKVCFLNTHLAAHINNDDLRIQQFDSIVNDMNFGGKASLLGHDFVFLAGDMNFRIEDLSKKDIIDHISANDLETLLKYDRLLPYLNTHETLCEFIEEEITFPPTYKFDVESDSYDSTYTQRLPAWTDRIMYRPNPVMKALRNSLRKSRISIKNSLQSYADNEIDEVQMVEGSYKSLEEFKQSDHRPVTALYDLKVPTDFDPLVEVDIANTWRHEESWIVTVNYDKDYESGGDYLALYEKSFSDFRDYKTWIYLPDHDKTSPQSVAFKFPFLKLQTMGLYRIGYYSQRMSCLLALSKPFSILV